MLVVEKGMLVINQEGCRPINSGLLDCTPPPLHIRSSYLCRYIASHDPDVAAFNKAGVARFREIADRAITAAGLHVCQGHEVWEAWRAYEEAYRVHVQGRHF